MVDCHQHTRELRFGGLVQNKVENKGVLNYSKLVLRSELEVKMYFFVVSPRYIHFSLSL